MAMLLRRGTDLISTLLRARAPPRAPPCGRRLGSTGVMRSMPVVRRALCTTAPPPAPKPPAFTPAQQILQSIKSMLPRVVTTGVVTHGEPIVYVEPKDVPIMLRFLRDHTGTRCKQLVDITAVDIPTREKRFEVGHPPAPHTPLLGRAPPAAHRTAPRTAPHRAPHRTAHRAPRASRGTPRTHDHDHPRDLAHRRPPTAEPTPIASWLG
jgi:hypothetical protein